MSKYSYLLETTETYLGELSETQEFTVKMIGDSLDLSPPERNKLSAWCHKWYKEGKLTRHGKIGPANVYRKVVKEPTRLEMQREADARRRILLDQEEAGEVHICANCKSNFTVADLGESFLAILQSAMRLLKKTNAEKAKIIKDHNELVNREHELKRHIDEQSKKILDLNNELAAGSKKTLDLHHFQTEFEKLSK